MALKNDEEVVLTYLKHISKSIDFLANHDHDHATAPTMADSQSSDYFMDRIARDLLFRVCSPKTLSQPIPQELVLKLFYPDGKEKPTRIKSRIDALRNIYRTMAPIALDIAARISALVVSKGCENADDYDDVCTNSFCLYAVWLPVSPQIAQFVMDLFEWDQFVSPMAFLEDQSVNANDMEIDDEGENAKSNHQDDKSVAVFSEMAYLLIKFFAERGDHCSMKDWWEWTKLFTLLGYQNSNYVANEEMCEDTSMDEDDDDDGLREGGWAQRSYSFTKAIKWFAARAVVNLFNLTPTSKGVFYKRIGLEEEMVPWVLHPWIIMDEEVKTQNNQLRGVISLLQDCKEVEIQAPSPSQIRRSVNLPSSLAHLGQGLVLPRKNTVKQQSTAMSTKTEDEINNHSRQGLVMTETTSSNLSLLGIALCSDPYPPPILVCGPRGSGKSSLIRELARYCSVDSSGSEGNDLLEIHVDEETDSKTLLGSYAATDIPGEFTWRPGALTNAVRKGKWVLLEDVESCPTEIQAALVKLFEERILPLGVGKSEKCHPNFRMFGTCTTASSVGTTHQKDRRLRKGVSSSGGGGKRLIHPGLWRKVHVDPLPYSELQTVSRDLFPNLPKAVSDAALSILRKIDKSGRTEDLAEDNEIKNLNAEEKKEAMGGSNKHTPPILGNGRHSSVRDLVKLLSRISSTIHFEPGATFCTESQRILCMAESFDIFAGWCPSRHLRKAFVSCILAPIWGISVTAAVRYIEDRQPQVTATNKYVEVGRSTIQLPPLSLRTMTSNENKNFAETNYSLRLMESAGICIAQNEPTLLVGETGCGKTTVIQRLASLSKHELVVQNLSLQTDSTDLLGGYRPLEIRHIARTVYTEFVQLFVSSFSKSQNAQFLDYVTEAYEKGNWKRLSQCFIRASKMGLEKMKQLKKKKKNKSLVSSEKWFEFKRTSERFEKQRIACDTGLAFVFTEGALVDAIRSGKWVLLDEINLASSETLERLCGLLDDAHGSVTLTEKGDSEALVRHPNFRIFAAMNPATDAGKKDLPSSLRSRFTELYVDELIDPVELRSVAAKYLNGVIAPSDKALEHTETVITAVDVYLKCRQLSEETLVDGGGHRPRYTLRTMCRSLSAARNLLLEQKFGVKRAIFEGFELGFEGNLNMASRNALRNLLTKTLGTGLSAKQLDHPGRKSSSGRDSNEFILTKPFWLKVGLVEKVDWSEASSSSKRSRFVLTPSMTKNLRRLSRAVASGPWPVLLEGPTSAGKTTMVEYLAAKCGHRCVRINNHEHTDVQEYTGSYASDSTGKLCFVEGILVQALRKGHWVILDELNLAPSEVLEALNRLLDDNRELYLPEINEVVKPHPSFRLFATQNPSGAYGGRKPLSKAFRNRFVEMHIGDIPEKEMITILELRCKCPPSHAKLLVKIMSALRKRRSKSGVFRGKDGLITPRDLLRWAERTSTTKHELAFQGYMLLAERLRDESEKILVKEVIEEHMKIQINCDDIYFGNESGSRKKLELISRMEDTARSAGLTLQAIAPTKSLLRLLTLVEKCVEQKEPVLLVGDTGCGKTTVVQLMSVLLDRELQIVNCHASTETSDLLGGLRPLRGRKSILTNLMEKSIEVFQMISEVDVFLSIVIPNYLKDDKSDRPDNVAPVIASLSKEIRSITCKEINSKEKNVDSRHDSEQSRKKRRLDNGDSDDMDAGINFYELIEKLDALDSLVQQHASLFEWVDGPLVCAMRKGDLFLLDEMSLAEDAVLERLNSVLEPSRTLVLAEKGGDLSENEDLNDSAEIVANEEFRIFATMNPGGDFGKRELSPALRSRFTEIWVPSVTDHADIDLVLNQTLVASFEKYEGRRILEATIESVKQCMLKYVNWFNNDVCSKPMSTFADFALSLRDILAWARFIVETTCSDSTLEIWSVYAHGASLMHLDGLGLGTGLAFDDAIETKKSAKRYLASQIPVENGNVTGFEDEYENIDESALYIDEKFGIRPFFIPMGTIKIPSKLGFKLSAPTTGMNLRRVLRAMQISKPILLEGSPGVGKTSLIAALAAASGHNLVRINLSEQTDISDLMGSDLPMPEETTDENGNASTGGSFKWCDGALLKAIKNGDWVLLDELNLASQSVLEGLNSCLDHRGCVYIPELGQTFPCPPTFRIFAAQNPLAQGGGRKGLPKSFLNRFTKVYVEALTKADLQGIVESKFPILPSGLVETIVTFNAAVQKDIEDRKYGQLGSPWEFNLRDVFRWCDLINCHYERTGNLEHEAFANTIYMQRLRSSIDRALLLARYEVCFGQSNGGKGDPTVVFERDHVHVGMASLLRNVAVLPPSDSIILGEEPSLLRCLAQPMEAVSLCIQMSWPCLLVGPAASGKSTILKLLAESCNKQLEDIALTPSSDVNELIGTFEQIDAAEVEARLLTNLKRIYHSACLVLTGDKIQLQLSLSASANYHKLLGKMAELRNEITAPVVISEKPALKFVGQFLTDVKKAFAISGEFRDTCAKEVAIAEGDFKSFQSYSKSKKSDNAAVHFRWIDGILIQALEKGYWLHLENVNFCPSSVLDRLNPLMETGGELVLTECGIDDDVANGGFGTSRVIKPHPNFRLFLSMNSSFGEVSRAMRNRCIEVSLLPPSTSECLSLEASADNLDAFDCLWHNGIRSSSLAKAMVHSHKHELSLDEHGSDDSQPSRNLTEWAKLTDDSLRRGFCYTNDLQTPQQVAYEIHSDEITGMREICHESLIRENFQMVSNVAIRHVLETSSTTQNIATEVRLLKAFVEGNHKIPLFASCFKDGVQSQDSRVSKFNKYAPSIFLNGDHRIPTIRSHLIGSFMRSSKNKSVDMRAFLLDGYCSNMSSALKFIAKRQNDEESRNIGSNEFSRNLSEVACSDRLSQILDENATLEKLSSFQRDEMQLADMSVIEISICIHDNKLDRSYVTCPVTPILCPFFIALDEYLKLVPESSLDTTISSAIPIVRGIFESRDRLWRFLKASRFIEDSSFLGFDEGGFLVQWTWFRKRLEGMTMLMSQSSSTSTAAKRNIDLIVGTIDRAIMIESGDIRMSAAYRKKIGHPLVPAKAQDSKSLGYLRFMASDLSLHSEENFGYQRLLSGSSANISMSTLFGLQHAALILDPDIKIETLTALCMAHWATTDEMSASTRMKSKKYDVLHVNNMLSDKVNSLKNEFVAKIRSCTVDTSINTIENKLDLQDLEELQESHYKEQDPRNNVMNNILTTFGEIQLTQMTEFICIRDEEWIVDNLASIIMMPDDAGMIACLRQKVAPRITHLIDMVVTSTIWPVSDLRPYQSLIWILDSNSVDAPSLRRFFSCSYSSLLSTLSRHYWCNSFNDLNSISREIASPSFWSLKSKDKGYDAAPTDSSVVMAGLQYYSGEPRINQNVVTEFLFRLQGFKRVADTTTEKTDYLTIENQEARVAQGRKALSLLATDLHGLKKKARKIDTLKFLLEGVVDASRESFENEETFSCFRQAITNWDKEGLSSIQFCKHRKFTILVSTVMPPLFDSMRNIDNSSSNFSVALASVFIGIFRFHLTLPASPLDPGKKPAAKVAQWNSQIQYLGSTLVGMRMESGLVTGNFEPDNDDVTSVMDDLAHGHKKLAREKKKCVERPSDIPLFYDLFKDVHHFASTVASVDSILELVRTLQDDQRSESDSTKKQKEVNWQASAVAFCNQMISKYAYYEDVTSPFLAALDMIRNGLRCIFHHSFMEEASSFVKVTKLQDKLLRYPNVQISADFDSKNLQEISASFEAVAKVNNEALHTDKMEKNSQLSYILSTLSNLCILKHRGAIDEKKCMEIASYIFQSMANAWKASGSGANVTDTEDETEEERLERQFREQFPDHAREFNKIIEAVEAVEYGGDVSADDEDVNIQSKGNDFSISDEQLIFLCDLHEELFTKKNAHKDSLRLKSFICTYVAAAQLNNAVIFADSQGSEVSRLNAHCYAVAVSSKNNPGTSVAFETFMRSDSSVDLNFHQDPNSSELIKADLPLRHLLERISQLMRAFPGNSILISIGQVVERIRQMNAKTTSLGKMLVGFEVILKKAQDWEQHASRRVALGECLQNISRLVAQWRRLELQSWSSLLNVRDQTHIVQAKRHWMRLYNILASEQEEPESKEDIQVNHLSKYACSFPSWIWMGQVSKLQNITKATLNELVSQDLFEVLKVLDTFILTSGIGQFHERLRLIDSFAHQLREECVVAYPSVNESKVSKATILDSFVQHYKNLSDLISTAKDLLRKPIEKRLKDEVKLAKWDEQSYYSLTDSSEKSHRKLMMIVHDYEQILHTSVGRILEEHFLNGIRPHSDVGAGPTAQPTTEVPSNSSIFPELQDLKSKTVSKSVDKFVALRNVKRSWTAIEPDIISDSKYISGVKKYGKKMDKLFSSNCEIHASEGRVCASEICDSVFERIDLLREKGSKPMKERALVDMFKLLKRQGYSSMKWCVPKQIREMNSLFQIKSPDSSSLNSQDGQILESAETYYHRCTAEIVRLRSEVRMMGSAYMGKREMDLMVGFSEHGLLMLCQQRANLTKAIHDIKFVSDLLHEVDKIQPNSKLPNNQVSLLSLSKKFDCRYNVCLEAMHQTFLMMKTISTQIDGDKVKCTDMIEIVEGSYSLLSDIYNPCTRKILITIDDIARMKNVEGHLEKVLDNVSSCVDSNRTCNFFPQEIFAPCLDEIHLLLNDVNKYFLECSKTAVSMPIIREERVYSKVTDIVKSSLLAAQTIHNGFIRTNDEHHEAVKDSNTLWENHSETLKEWDSINMNKFGILLQELMHCLQVADGSENSRVEGISSDACTLLVKLLDVCQCRLTETLKFYRSVAKFEYVKIRIFRSLIAKGFCADDVEDGGDADGEGGEGNAKFEDDVEGTGMGEGEGKNDVTDQIENEEQLLGLKGDEDNDKEQEQKELNEEEAETGMEMENEFDGEMFDVPDKQEDNNEDQDEDEEEELDREMGDGNDPNEQVVDEKMWDEDEDEEEQNQQEEEKFEKDSKMSGEALEDELRTKEDEEGTGEEGKDDKSPENGGDNHEEDMSKNEDVPDKNEDEEAKDNIEDDLVNNDFEDDYEDKNDGVDVRNEEDVKDPDEDADDPMDLDDELDLNDGDEGDTGGADDAGAEIGEEEDGDSDEGENTASNEIDENEEADQGEEEEEEDMDPESTQSAHQTLGDDDQMNADEEPQEEEPEPEEANHNINNSADKQEDAHGVASKSGPDSVKREEEEGENDEGQGEDEDEDAGAGEGEKDDTDAGAGQSDTNSGDIQSGEQGSGTKSSSTSMDAPNPFRDPGDAEKFWHKKLNVIADAQDEEAEEANVNEEDNPSNDEGNPDGDFEFTSNEQENSTQVLGGVAEDDTTKLNREEDEEKANNPDEDPVKEERKNDSEMTKRQSSSEENSQKNKSEENDEVQDDDSAAGELFDNEVEEMDKDTAMEEEASIEKEKDDDEDIEQDNRIVTDLDQLQVRDAEEHEYQTGDMVEDEEYAGVSFEQMEEARKKWSELQAETNSLSRRLCEKLRLVMEPLVASKLRGDYRTGKRINMKRVIGYIASGYRKDKIWLRRTKPGKRDYRILLAVDNSESMKNGAGDMALTALTTLANGMSQLEIGELGVASFGEEMKLLHPFHAPFTSASGVDLLSNFQFDDKRTRTALCVESALAALEAQSSTSSSMQLVFIISDGRIERDSRERLRRIVREMTEKNVLLIMVVVEGDQTDGVVKSKDSIVNMKEVSFDNGKPKVKHFIDDYPFPYYMVLQDMHTLPEVLGDALKQWFEMMTQNQAQG